MSATKSIEEPKKKKRKGKSKKGEWKELTIHKTEFQEIIKILNRFYFIALEENKSPSLLFREDLCKIDSKNLKIYFQKFGTYEFLVKVIIRENECDREDTWIHIDGIQQERDEILKKGRNDHPVFSLTCISDLYKVSNKIL